MAPLFKRFLLFFASAIIILTLIPSSFSKKVQAYQNSVYFNDLKIGLIGISSTSLSLTLNGEYTLNGQPFSSGTIFTLRTNGTSINVNGLDYNEINLVPKDSSNLLIITSGSATYKYLGSFVFKAYGGKILPINYIDMENYLNGVVGYELSDSSPLEALKAQAVAARNYALSRIGWESAKGYDLDDTINYQVYKGYDSNLKNVIRAVGETKGEVLLYNDKLVETLYSAWHGGYSEDSENVWGNTVPYLRSVQDPFENDAWPNGNRTFTNAQIQSTLVSKKYLTSADTFIALDLNSITKYASGRVSNINVIYKDSTGTTVTKSVTKDATRTFLGLPSNMYNVVYDQNTGIYTFSGKGYGHGLGMSQIGAKNRAIAGQSYEQILKFYYTNSYLQNLIIKASLSSITENKDKLFIGENISFNATASSGNGYGYLFKYVIKNSGNTVYTRDFNTTASLDYTPMASGNYTTEVYVRDKYSPRDYDDMKVVSANVYSKPVFNNVIASGSFFENKAISLNANTSGGSSSGVNYKYEIYKDNSLVFSNNFNTSNAFSFIPATSGTYFVKAYIKDSISNNSYDSLKEFSFNILSKPLYLSKLPLSIGTTNTDVVSLQKALIKLGYSLTSATGYFGTQTQSAVISFQKSRGLYADGIVGSITYNALNEALIQQEGIKTISY